MKLDYDCIRDLLIYLENNISLKSSPIGDKFEYENIMLHSICCQLEDYTVEDIIYTALKLHEANMITIEIMGNDSYITDIRFIGITYNGHQYLDTVRSSTIWEEIKSAIKSKAVDISVNAIFTMAKELVKNRIIH